MIVRDLMYRARKLIKQYAKWSKEENKKGKEDKRYKFQHSREFTEYQQMLKNAPKEYRRYNRKLNVYEPITPKGKERKSERFEQFVYDLNEQQNLTPTLEQEQEKRAIMREKHITSDIYDKLSSYGVTPHQYSSDGGTEKHIHLDTAIERYGDMNDAGFRNMVHNIQDNIDKYSIYDIYDMVSSYNSINNGVMAFDDYEL